MDYKVGDKVIIFKPTQDILKQWNNSWVDSMDQYIGKEVIIENISSSHFHIKGPWSWPLEILYNQHNKESHYEIY